MNLRRLFQLQDGADVTFNAVVASLDAEKAFDSLDWKYMFMALRRFGFGEHILRIVGLLYNGPSAVVVTNNTTSGSFSLYRGTRQGCPLSPLLITLGMELLAAHLRYMLRGDGIFVREMESIVSLYADDMLIYLQEPKADLPYVLELIDDFGALSGFKINCAKSLVYPLGEADEKVLSEVPLHWAPTSFKYLGIIICKPATLLYMPLTIRRYLHNLRLK